LTAAPTWAAPSVSLVPPTPAADDAVTPAHRLTAGHRTDATTTPLDAGLGWTVKLEDHDFIGRDVLVRQKEAGSERRLVALVVEDRIPRPHCPILVDGVVVGEVTSGTRSPSLDWNIALGYVDRRLARPGTEVDVDVRGKIARATVHKGAFYTRPY